jgi:uncharacterized protein involved in exopolysaccharide biosynthesis
MSPSSPELIHVFSEIRRRWWLPGGLMLLFGSAALIWGLLNEKVYRVEAILAPIAEEEFESNLSQLAGQFTGIATMLGVNLGSAGRSENVAIATLHSRQFTADFIQDQELLPVLFASQWDESRHSWRETRFGRPPSLAHAVDVFDEKIRGVRQDRRTGLVHLTIEWTDPEVAVAWANTLVRDVNELMRARAVSEAEESIRFLSTEATKTNLVGVQQAAYRLIQSQLNRITLTKVREDYAFRVVDPATVPDERNYVRPRFGIIVPLGLVFGLSLGVFIVLARSRVVNDRRV